MTLRQVTLSWLKEPGNEEHIAALRRAGESLRQIPGVLGIEFGHVARLGRPSQDESFDVAMLITFASADAARNYGPHPLHVQAAQQSQAYVAQVRSYSFEV